MICRFVLLLIKKINFMSTSGGWVRDFRYRDNNIKITRCLICGDDTKKEQIHVCSDLYCRLTFKVVAKKVSSYFYPKLNEDKINFLLYRSTMHNGCAWYLFPPREVVLQKRKEVIAKGFLLNKISDAEFIRKFKSISDVSFCNPCQIIFKQTNYEKHDSVLNAR